MFKQTLWMTCVFKQTQAVDDMCVQTQAVDGNVFVRSKLTACSCVQFLFSVTLRFYYINVVMFLVPNVISVFI